MNEIVRTQALTAQIEAERRLWSNPADPIGEVIVQIPKVTKSSKPRKPAKIRSVTKTAPDFIPSLK